MHKEIEKIKELEGPIKVIKNLYSKDEINKFLELYNKLPTTVHNKKQNVIKKKMVKRHKFGIRGSFLQKT